MHQHIINQAVIAAMQYLQFEEKKYEQIFKSHIEELEKLTGKNREQVIDLIIEELGGQTKDDSQNKKVG